MQCSVRDCQNESGYQTDEERGLGVTVCDPDRRKKNHYLELLDALDRSWGDAKRWVEANCR